MNWEALPLAVEFYGVTDVEAVIERVLVVKGHKKPAADDTQGDQDDGAA